MKDTGREKVPQSTPAELPVAPLVSSYTFTKYLNSQEEKGSQCYFTIIRRDKKTMSLEEL